MSNVTEYPLHGEDFPCIICERPLKRAFDEQGQPLDGVICSTHGNYGSTVFDPLDGTYLAFNICDTCLEAKKAFIKITRSSRHVVMTYLGVVGNERVDRPYLDWDPDTANDRDEVHIELAELDTLPAHVTLNPGLTPETLKESYLIEEEHRGDK